jgi:hypothetical protein
MATAKKTDEANKTKSESNSPSDATEGVETPEAKKSRSVADRVKDIEVRWGKDIQEVMVELHDHVFGTSRPHEEVKAEQDAKKKADETK